MFQVHTHRKEEGGKLWFPRGYKCFHASSKTRTLRLFSFLFRHARRETKYKTKQKHQKNINLFEEDKKCRILYISQFESLLEK